MIRLANIEKVYRTEQIETVALANVNLDVARRRVRLHHGALGLRQEHAAERDGPARRAHARARSTLDGAEVDSFERPPAGPRCATRRSASSSRPST